MYGHQQLLPGTPLMACGVHDKCNVSLLLRLRGGGSAKTLQLTVQPRVQKEKWSLYWKESMSTKTLSLDPIQLDVDGNTSIAEVTSAVLPCAVQKQHGMSHETACVHMLGTLSNEEKNPSVLTADCSCTQVQQLVAKRCKWEPVESLQRLDGFAESWERVLYRGVSLPCLLLLAVVSRDREVDSGVLSALTFCLLPGGSASDKHVHSGVSPMLTL